MHQALPPRKFSHAPHYARSTMSSSFRRKRLKIIGLVALGILVLYLGLTSLLSPKAVSIPSGSPEVVIVTVMEPDLGSDYVAQIKENRDEYAARHGYMTFYPNTSDYNVGSAPRTWSLIPALRHAMTLYPHTTYFFSLSPHALFMNPALSLTSHIMAPQRLESLMLKDKPVVPPDSVIHTFSHIKGDKIDLILTQDGEGLCQESFILRQGEWAQFFLDIWFDPLYRSYNFQKAEGHALEHIVQWHPTILTKLSLIPQRTLNSYTVKIESRGGDEVTYKEGDYVVRAVGCELDKSRDCAKEMDPWFQQWKRDRQAESKP
ncbi:hypothetical protein MMC32_007393 [Xylographa parallela]|nr:hypothetical protein [Xylographa parallela]